MKKIFLRIVITCLMIFLIFLSKLICPIITPIFIAFLILFHIFLNKFINRIGYLKTVLISLIPFIIVIVVIGINYFIGRKEVLDKWNVVKNDYEIINKIANDYYKNSCMSEYCDDRAIILYFSDDLTKLINYIDFTPNGKYGNYNYIELSDEEQISLKNIKEYHKGQDFIAIGIDSLEYTNETGYFAVIYSKNGKKPKFGYNSSIEHLTGNWYRTW